MNIFEGADLNTMQFIGPLIVLVATMVLTAIIFKLLFSWLPSKLFNFFLGPVALVGAYIWAVPMNLGFHELFKYQWGIRLMPFFIDYFGLNILSFSIFIRPVNI